MQRKLARNVWRPCQQVFNTLPLDPWNVCPSRQRLQDPDRRKYEERGVMQQDFRKQAEIYLTGRVDTCK